MFTKNTNAECSSVIQQDPESPFGGSAAAPVCCAESGCRALLMALRASVGSPAKKIDKFAPISGLRNSKIALHRLEPPAGQTGRWPAKVRPAAGHTAAKVTWPAIAALFHP